MIKILRIFVLTLTDMPKKRFVKQEFCAYCGINVANTRDHVIPKCLFTPPLPSNMVTVPVCNSCNLQKSKDEDYLRDTLVCEFDASQHSVAQQIFQSKLLRSVKRNSSAVARSAIMDGTFIPMFTRSGIYIGQHRAFPVDGQRITRACIFIVRGLYYKLTKKSLPQEVLFEVNRVDLATANEIALSFTDKGFNGPYKIGDGVFGCAFLYGEEDASLSFWLIWFYNSVFITVSTEAKLSNQA
jgi:hypothetical protein